SRSINSQGEGRLLKTASKSSRVSCITLQLQRMFYRSRLGRAVREANAGPGVSREMRRMYHGEGSRQVKGLPGLAASSGVEMELDNLAGRACDSQSSSISSQKAPSKAAVSSGRLHPTDNGYH